VTHLALGLFENRAVIVGSPTSAARRRLWPLESSQQRDDGSRSHRRHRAVRYQRRRRLPGWTPSPRSTCINVPQVGRASCNRMTGRPAALVSVANRSPYPSGRYGLPSSSTNQMLPTTVSTARGVSLPCCQSVPCLCVLRDRRAAARPSSSGNVRRPRSVFGSPSTTPAPTTRTRVIRIVMVFASRSTSDQRSPSTSPRRSPYNESMNAAPSRSDATASRKVAACSAVQVFISCRA
jgi:hypothetical protein